MSHYNLWKQLLNDNENEYYVILEDDITFCDNFKSKYDSLKEYFIKEDMEFLGYSMIEKERKFKLKYPVFDELKGVRIKQGYLI